MTDEFNDNYSTCARTYSTVLIIRDDLDPDAVTERLQVTPTDTLRKGQSLIGRRYKATIGSWQFSSKYGVESRDVRRHIVWLLDAIEGKEAAFQKLRGEGCETVMSCYWVTAQGHGGPMLDPRLMRRLSDFGMELWFDIYGPFD